MSIWQEFLQGISDHPSLYLNVVVTIIVILFMYGLRRLFMRLFSRRVEDTVLLYQWQKNKRVCGSFISPAHPCSVMDWRHYGYLHLFGSHFGRSGDCPARVNFGFRSLVIYSHRGVHFGSETAFN